METKKIDFIIKYFGCYTTIDGKKVLTSLANASRVSVEEFWNVFSGDAKKYFEIRETEEERELSLILDNAIKKKIEREIEFDRISKLEVGFGWKWINDSVRCYLKDTKHQKQLIPFLFVLDDYAVQGGYIGDRLNTRIFDKANLIPVNSGAEKLEYEPHFGGYGFKGGKFGCINKVGKVQIPLVYDKCIRFTNPYTAIAEKDGKKYLINKWGEYLNQNYDDLICFYGDYCVVKQNEKFGIIDYSLNEIIPIEYDKITCRCSGRNIPMFNTVTLYIGSHCGLYDLLERRFLVDIAYDAIVEHRENKNYYSVCINGKWGLIDLNGSVIVPLEYYYLVSSRDHYLVKQNGKYGVVDKNLGGDYYYSEWENIEFNNPIPCIYDEVYDSRGNVNHKESLFYFYRYYFAKYGKNGVQLDCYYRWSRYGKNGVQFFTYEKRDSLICEESTIKQTIVLYERECAKQNSQQ